nr:nonspecific lipid transfer protein 7 [Solanum melongena]WJJ08751.1 nsLTP7 [Solanum melongena]
MAKIACIVVLCMVVLFAPHTQALTCTDVDTYLAECVPYLTEPLGLLGTCCDGVKELNAAATTTIDRQTACNCLKAEGSTLVGIDWVKASALPTTCGVTIPYLISADIDCSTYSFLRMDFEMRVPRKQPLYLGSGKGCVRMIDDGPNFTTAQTVQ